MRNQHFSTLLLSGSPYPTLGVLPHTSNIKSGAIIIIILTPPTNAINRFSVSPIDDNFNESRSAHSLDLIYDIRSLNNVLLRKKFSPLADFDQFLQYSSRNVVVAHYISPREARELAVMKGDVGNKIEQGFKGDNIIDCREHLTGYLTMLERAINSDISTRSVSLQSRHSMDKYHIIKYWCINMSVFSTPQESAAKMEIGSDEDVTIIIVNWRGLGSKQVIKSSVKGLHMNNRIAMFNTCKQHIFINWKNILTYSPLILQTARQFAASLRLKQEEIFAVVHIRSEKLGLREPRLPRVTEACFEELMRLTQNLAGSHPLMRFIYITDYGPYSSDTCRKCRGSKDVKRFLHKKNITPSYFEPSYFNMTNDTGFAASVEAQFMSSASFLFLCGGGGYQNQIATRFQILKRRRSSVTKTSGDAREKGIFKVCNDDNEIHTLLRKKFG